MPIKLSNIDIMIPKPAKLLSASLLLALLATVVAFLIGGLKSGIGVLTAVSVLWINLFLWNVVVKALIRQSAYGTGSKSSVLFFLLKLAILSIGIFAMAMLLSPMYVFIANTVIVVSLIGVSLTTIYQSRLR
ncbi:MAG: hypothetical protein ACON4U_06780 [Myxococcota bacterium]